MRRKLKNKTPPCSVFALLRKFTVFIATLALVTTAAADQATSTDIGERLKHFLNITPQEFAHEQQFIYKAWPSYPGRYLIAHYLIFDPDNYTGEMLPIAMEVVDKRGNQFVRVASGTYSFVLDPGFSRPQLRSIDTAHYKLKPGMIAFGLDTFQNMGGHATQSGRTLFRVTGALVQEITGPFLIASEYRVFDVDQHVTSGVISMSDRQTNGYHDIIFRQTEKNWIEGKTEEMDASITVTTHVRRWDGTRYR